MAVTPMAAEQHISSRSWNWSCFTSLRCGTSCRLHTQPPPQPAASLHVSDVPWAPQPTDRQPAAASALLGAGDRASSSLCSQRGAAPGSGWDPPQQSPRGAAEGTDSPDSS